MAELEAALVAGRVAGDRDLLEFETRRDAR
jgi:hypothetical protein